MSRTGWTIDVDTAQALYGLVGAPTPMDGDRRPVRPTQWKWTCQECGATGAMPEDILETPHDCKSRGPFEEVARLLVEPVEEKGSAA